jgi:hypothetical protein
MRRTDACQLTFIGNLPLDLKCPTLRGNQRRNRRKSTAKKPQSDAGIPHPITLEPVLYTLPNLGDYWQHVIHEYTEKP